MRTEQIGDATLYLGDARDVLTELPDNSIDMIWTDPPYGHSNHNNGDLNSRLNAYRDIVDQPIANDSPELMRETVDAVLNEAARVLKADCCCCCCCCGGGGPRPTFAWLAERMDQRGLSFFHSVIWDKVNPGLGWRYRRRHEMVMVAHRTGGKLLWQNDSRAIPNIVTMFPGRERFHPNEKPIDFIGLFLEAHSSPQHVILDPFMGSGSTGVAALGLGRRFIGVELEERWFDIACQRLRAEVKEPRLFATNPRAIQEAFL